MAAGTDDALQLIYLEFGPIVNGVVRHILQDPEEAREAVQDTFIKAWRNAASYRADRGEVVSWLVFMARNTAIDRVRRGARRRVVHEALRHQADDVALPHTEAIETKDDVARRLDALSSSQRQALELAFFNGYTQAEIAAVMQTPVGNVKNHLRRGLQRLRKLATGHE